MTIELKQSTAVTVQFGPFLDAGDGVVPETGLATNMDNATTGIRVSKNGAAMVDRNSSTAPTHDDDGYYRVHLDATDTNTLGQLTIQYEESGTCTPLRMDFGVVTANYWDTKYSTDQFDVNVTNIIGTAPTLTNSDLDVNVAQINGQTQVNPGASGGLFIAGTNAPVTITGSGNALTLSSSGGNGVGLNISGNGTGNGILSQGGATSGNGMACVGGGTGSGILANSGSGATGAGISCAAQSTNGQGLLAQGSGTSPGIQGTGAGTGHGLLFQGGTAGGATSGDGARFQGGAANGANAGGFGMRCLGGAGTTTAGGTAGEGLGVFGGASATTTNIAGRGLFAQAGADNGAGGNAGGRFEGQGPGAEHALVCAGSGGGAGIIALGGNLEGEGFLAVANAESPTGQTGAGIRAESSASATGAGISAEAMSTNGDGLELIGTGTGQSLDADAVNEIADQVWDEALSGHNTGGSAGKALSNASSFIVTDGTCQATGQTTTNIRLAAGESSTDEIYTNDEIVITGGTGAGESALITAYDGTNKDCTVSPALVITCDGTSTYEIVPAHAHAENLGTDAVDAASLATGAVNEIARAIGIQKNNAKNDFTFLMVDDTNHAPSTGLTVSGTRSIDGAAFGAVTGTIAEIANGIYQFDASAADLNGDMIIFRFTATNADDAFLTVKTVA